MIKPRNDTVLFSYTSSHVGIAWCEPGARQISSCIFRGDSACNLPDSVSGDAILRRQQTYLELFLRLGNDP